MSGRVGMTGNQVVRGDAEFGKVLANAASQQPQNALDSRSLITKPKPPKLVKPKTVQAPKAPKPPTPATVTKGEKRDRSGLAVGAGSTLAGVGLLGGGVPGARPDSGRLQHAAAGTKPEAVRHLVSAGRGGIFGYRTDAHSKYLADEQKVGVKRRAARARQQGKPLGPRSIRFLHATGEGKIEPEKKIIRHLKVGRAASNAALVGGAALTAGGLHARHKNVSKAERRRDTYGADIAIGAGGTTALGAAGLSRTLDRQGRKWAKDSARELRAAGEINPKLGEHEVRRTRTRVPDPKPKLSTYDVASQHRTVLRHGKTGRSEEALRAAGKHRGAASQGRYFGGVYGAMARHVRTAGKAGALLAAGGLGAHYAGGKKIEKNLAMPKGDRSVPGARARIDDSGRIYFPPTREPAPVKAVPKGSGRKGALLAGGALLLGGGAAGHAVGRRERVTKAGNLKRAGVSLASGLVGGVAANQLPQNQRDSRTLLKSKKGQLQPLSKAETTMSEDDAKRVAGKYGLKGPLPKGLSREARMKAYEGRYIAAGGKKGEKWHRRAEASEVGRNIGLAGATLSAGALLATRGHRLGPKLASTRAGRFANTHHRLETAGLASAAGGGASELYGEHARSRQASYSSSPAGVARSALTRMQAYTPEKRTR